MARQPSAYASACWGNRVTAGPYVDGVHCPSSSGQDLALVNVIRLADGSCSESYDQTSDLRRSVSSWVLFSSEIGLVRLGRQ